MAILSYSASRKEIIRWFDIPNDLVEANEGWIDYHAKGLLAWRIVTEGVINKRSVNDYFDFHAQLEIVEKFRNLRDTMLEDK